MISFDIKPYIAIAGLDCRDNVTALSILHSMEEHNIPYRICDADKNTGNGKNLFDIIDSALGIIVIVNETDIQVYFEEYSKKNPVFIHVLTGSEKEDYYAGRVIGSNIANLLQRKELKEVK